MGEESRLKGMPKISNITNASDPASIGSRVFVGNLNTFTLTKDDVENVFKRYGKIQGISMHKGYAFVQYANEFDARNSVAGEDQRIYAGQPLDVNMAAEPKPNRQSRKRNITTEWDCFFDAPLVQPTRTILPQVTPPVKRTRTELSPALVKRSLVALPTGTPLATAQLARLIQPTTFPIRKTSPAPCHNNKKRESSLSPRLPSPPVLSDILICGNCRQLFVDVESLTEHKKVPCRLRFADETDEPKCLACVNCNAIFHSCWNLLQHAQAEHDTNIYCIVNSNNDSNDREEVTEENDKQSSLENGHDEIEPETEDKRDNESDVTEENGDKSCDI